MIAAPRHCGGVAAVPTPQSWPRGLAHALAAGFRAPPHLIAVVAGRGFARRADVTALLVVIVLHEGIQTPAQSPERLELLRLCCAAPLNTDSHVMTCS